MRNGMSKGEILFRIFLVLWVFAMIIIFISAVGSIFFW